MMMMMTTMNVEGGRKTENDTDTTTMMNVERGGRIKTDTTVGNSPTHKRRCSILNNKIEIRSDIVIENISFVYK